MFLKIKYLNFLDEKQKNNVEKLSKLLREMIREWLVCKPNNYKDDKSLT